MNEWDCKRVGGGGGDEDKEVQIWRVQKRRRGGVIRIHAELSINE